MLFFKPRSVQQKMTSIIFLVSVLVLVLTSVQFVFFELKHRQDTAHDDIVSLSKLISASIQLPIAIKDVSAAESVLDSLGARKDVVSAYLLFPDGQTFASYSRSQHSHSRLDSKKELNFLKTEASQIAEGLQLSSESFWRVEDRLAYFLPLAFEGSPVGYLYLSTELLDLRKHQLTLALGWLLAMGAAMLVTYLLSVRLQRQISSPIEQLAAQMKQISRDKRMVGFVPKDSDDEFNLLFHGFDEMMRALKERDRLLDLQRKDLELEVKIRTRALEKEKERAEQATMAKSRFLANMSHEIRTPMIGVLGMADVLRQKKLSEQDLLLVETIYRSGDALLNILNDILDFSKVEAGRLKIDTVPTDLLKLVEDVVFLMGVNAREKGIEVVLTPSDGLPLLEGDPSRIRQILLNLIGNAVKFTETGKVTVSLSACCRLAEAICDCSVVIKDTGVGIPEEVQSRIFDSFDQGDGGTTKKYGGTGLGLAISKELIQLMGGTISVESRLDEGSTFLIQLPMVLSKQTELAPFREGPVPPEPVVPVGPVIAAPVVPGVRRVLLAEDNPTTQHLISILIQQMGIELTVVDNGQAAIDALASQKVDLVLMDCQMPVLDGFDATVLLREQGLITPIIALTAYARGEDEEQCIAAGMSDFLSKPFKQSELRAVLARWLGDDCFANSPVTTSDRQSTI